MTSLFVNRVEQIIDNLNGLCENQTPINLDSLLNTICAKMPSYGFNQYGVMHILTNFGTIEKEYAMDIRLLKNNKLSLFLGTDSYGITKGTVVIQRIERIDTRKRYSKVNREVQLLSYMNSLLLNDENLNVSDFYFAFDNGIQCIVAEDYDSNGSFYIRYLNTKGESIAEVKVKGEYPNEVVEGSDEVRHIQKIIFRDRKLYERFL